MEKLDHADEKAIVTLTVEEPKKKKPRGTPFQKGNKFECGSKKNKEKPSLSEYIKNKTKDVKNTHNVSL